MDANAPLEFKRWLKICLPNTPFAGISYLVGGCVRDEMLGLPYSDLDAVVEREGGAQSFCEYLYSLAPDSISKPHNLGAGYPIWQLVFKDDVQWQGQTFFLKGAELEVADTQKEMFPDPASRKRVAVFGTLAEDCLRRDFTSNMLYQNLVTQEILDPSTRGIADIRAGQLAGHPQADIVKIFTDDPLRMIRLFRFQCRFGWSIEPRLLDALEATRARLSILSAERIRDEWIRVMEMGKQAPFLRQLNKYGIVDLLFPELVPMKTSTQDKIYHSEGNVWVHTLMVVEKSPSEIVLQLAALLHDVGKPATRSEHGERVKFLEHEKVSCKISEPFLKKWKFSDKVIQEVLLLISLHLRGGDVGNWKSLKPARKLLRDAGTSLPKLIRLITADSASSLGPDGLPRTEHIEKLNFKLIEAAKIPILAKPLLGGGEIMTLLNLEPGPAIKEAQALLLEFEDQCAEAGIEMKKDAAENWLKAAWKTKKH